MTEYGRYELLERIGQGALTEVFRAKSHGVEGFEKVLVVKRLLEEHAQNPGLVEDFTARAQMALRLSHSNVVQLLDLGEVEVAGGKSVFLATELVTGITLADVLEQRRRMGQPLSLELALHIAAELCRALDHAHRRRDARGQVLGVVHQRLTPSNVFLSDEGEVKVSDFCTAALTPANEVTRPYLAPGDQEAVPDPRGDLYSLGAILFEMLRLSTPDEEKRKKPSLGSPADTLLGQLLNGSPGLSAAEVHEQLLMLSYSCKDWVSAGHVGELVSSWDGTRSSAPPADYPAELERTQSSRPPPQVVTQPGQLPSLGDFRVFVGRSEALAQVGRRLAISAHRRLQAVGVVGAAGMGKSRFIFELRRRLRRGGLNLAFHIARCPVGGADRPYSAINAMLRTLFGVSGSRPLDMGKLDRGLRALGLSGARADAILSELGAYVAASSALPLRAALVRVMASLADDRMHVFAWDACERFDAASAELLAEIASPLEKKRIALLFSSRERLHGPLNSLPGYEEVPLTPLGERSLARMLRLRLGVGEVPEKLEQFVRERSGGNPMFVEEILREAVHSGALLVSEGQVKKLDLDGVLSVPETLMSLLSNRTRRTSDDELKLLHQVALLDEWADRSLLSQALGVDVEKIDALFDGLLPAGLLAVEGNRIRLPLELMREALDRDLSPDQRARHRLDAAKALLCEPVDDARRLEEAARCLEAAGETQRAAETYERAARARQKSARPERTVPLMIRALNLVPLETREARHLGAAVKLLADSLVIRQQHQELENVVRRVTSHVFGRTEADPGVRVDTLLDLARALRSTLHYVEAQQMLLRTLELAKDDHARLRKVRLALADTQIALGDFLPAIKTLDLLGAEKGDDKNADAHEVLVLGAHAHAQAQNRLKALSMLKRADALVGPTDHELACRTAQVRALSHALAGDWQGSAAAAGVAAAKAHELGLVQQEISYRHYEGEALTHLGENARAYAAFRSSLDLARDAGAERWINRNRMLIAFLEGRDGSASARNHVGESLAFAERHHHTQDVAKGRLLVGQLLQAQGDPAGAQRELQLARQVATSIGHQLLVLEVEEALKSH